MYLLWMICSVIFAALTAVSFFINRPSLFASSFTERVYTVSVFIGIVSIGVLLFWQPRADIMHRRDNVAPILASFQECLSKEEDFDSNFIYDFLIGKASDVTVETDKYNFTFNGLGYTLYTNNKSDTYTAIITCDSYTMYKTLYTVILDKDSRLVNESVLEDYNLNFKYLIFLAIVIPIFGIICDHHELNLRKKYEKSDADDTGNLYHSAIINAVFAIVMWYLVYFLINFK